MEETKSLITESVSSLAEYVVAVEKVKDHWTKLERIRKRVATDDPAVRPWFRGLSSVDRKLQASIVYMNAFDHPQDEFWFNENFRRRAHQYVDNIPADEELDRWYMLMRHHRAPNRMTDWTEGSLIALFFAVEEEYKSVGNAVVHMFHPFRWNLCVTEAYAVPPTSNEEVMKLYLKPNFIDSHNRDSYMNQHVNEAKPGFGKYAIAVRPPLIHPRMVAQRSVFTIHGSNLDDLRIQACEFKDMNLLDCQSSVLQSIPIDRSSKSKIREELALAGITHQSVYPDMEGLVLELRDRFRRGDAG